MTSAEDVITGSTEEREQAWAGGTERHSVCMQHAHFELILKGEKN